jgi:lipopolysaccharide export system permease protein
VDVTTGIRDFDLITSLIKYYFLTLCFLAAIFMIFTAFELWKFAGTIDGGIFLLLRYLFYLSPFMYIQLSPSAAMVATLATYAIKSRQNEIITWTSAGQSVYRLLLPCLLLMILIGALNWQLQERVAPSANQKQDELRNQIRARGMLAKNSGKYWVATDQRIYSFEADISDNKSASDNDPNSVASECPAVCRVRNLTIYEYKGREGNLQTLYQAGFAVWTGDVIRFEGPVEKTILSGAGVVTTELLGGEVNEQSNPFAETRKKPSHLNRSETKEQLESSESEIERRSFSIALEKKYTTLVLPFVIALFTAPFALSLSRKGKVVTIGYAVGLWLLFMGLTSAFEQFGLNGSLPPSLAVWIPLVVFSILGIYLLSKVRT